MTTKKTQKMKFKKAPGAPKRFKSAYMFFSEHQHKVHRENAGNKKVRAADVAKLVSQAWKDLPDQDRMVWVEMGRRDRDRYEREKAAYKGPWKIPDIKDPNAPKKPMSAFLAFGNERRAAIADANPSLTGTEISSLLSKLWKECPEEIKQAYRDREARERKEFKKVHEEWERKRDAELVSEYRSVTVYPGDEASHEETCDETSQAQQSQQVAPQTICQSQRLSINNSFPDVPENIPTNVMVPGKLATPASYSNTFMVSDDTLDEYLPDEAWPFNRLPHVISLPVLPSFSRVLPAKKPFEQYSLDDVLQDDELFFEDFSPSEVVSHPTSSTSAAMHQRASDQQMSPNSSFPLPTLP